MNEIITLMYVCEGIAKDIHYNWSGLAFYAVHTMMDKVDFSEERDALIEAAYLSEGLTVPTTAKFFSDASVAMNAQEGVEPLSKLSEALTNMIYLVEEKKRVVKPYAGIHAILDSVSQKALVIKGLVNRTVGTDGGR